MILIVASRDDAASLNIARQILSHYSFDKVGEGPNGNPMYVADVNGEDVKLVTLRGELTYAQNVTELFPSPRLVIFLSRHSSVSGTPTLSVHTPGNLGEAEFGGLPRRVSISPANAMRAALMAMARLKEEMTLDYKVCYECVHHGPSLDVPAMFIELGSSYKQWGDLRAAEALAHASMETVLKLDRPMVKAVLGLGGPHYNEKFTRMALENEVAFGHIIPKYAIQSVDERILRHCVERTLEEVDSAILDWKGIRGEDRLKLIEILKGIGLKLQKA